MKIELQNGLPSGSLFFIFYEMSQMANLNDILTHNRQKEGYAMYTKKENLIQALETNNFDFGINPVLFTHTDLDGVSCAVLFYSKFGRYEDVFYLNNNEVDERIIEELDVIEADADMYNEPLRTLIITDLSVNKHTAERLEMYVQKGGNVLLLDHHNTALWLNNYTWAIVDTGASGTLLAYNYLNINSEYRKFSMLVDDYDRWVHDDEKSIQLNRLFFAYGRDRFVGRFYINSTTEFTEGERTILAMEDENKEHYRYKVSKNIEVHYLGKQRIGIGYADRYTSEIAHDLMQEHNLHAVALIDVLGGRVSLRSLSTFDVSALAKHLGGGGHVNASGFIYRDKPKNHITSELHETSQKLKYRTFEIVFGGME